MGGGRWGADVHAHCLARRQGQCLASGANSGRRGPAQIRRRPGLGGEGGSKRGRSSVGRFGGACELPCGARLIAAPRPRALAPRSNRLGRRATEGGACVRARGGCMRSLSDPTPSPLPPPFPPPPPPPPFPPCPRAPPLYPPPSSSRSSRSPSAARLTSHAGAPAATADAAVVGGGGWGSGGGAPGGRRACGCHATKPARSYSRRAGALSGRTCRATPPVAGRGGISGGGPPSTPPPRPSAWPPRRARATAARTVVRRRRARPCRRYSPSTAMDDRYTHSSGAGGGGAADAAAPAHAPAAAAGSPWTALALELAGGGPPAGPSAASPARSSSSSHPTLRTSPAGPYTSTSTAATGRPPTPVADIHPASDGGGVASSSVTSAYAGEVVGVGGCSVSSLPRPPLPPPWRRRPRLHGTVDASWRVRIAATDRRASSGAAVGKGANAPARRAATVWTAPAGAPAVRGVTTKREGGGERAPPPPLPPPPPPSAGAAADSVDADEDADAAAAARGGGRRRVECAAAARRRGRQGPERRPPRGGVGARQGLAGTNAAAMTHRAGGRGRGEMEPGCERGGWGRERAGRRGGAGEREGRGGGGGGGWGFGSAGLRRAVQRGGLLKNGCVGTRQGERDVGDGLTSPTPRPHPITSWSADQAGAGGGPSVPQLEAGRRPRDRAAAASWVASRSDRSRPTNYGGLHTPER
ncbi:hypothetical protein I4F81_000762 [Pyropia yezoensis]|uniref:Uncharacterized protein n=1 Tax=Pyropia yezoensis TaxID=2788 RepID=A0ACC3BJL7_PYRYE|nr:hypothetical protein I4F81_000762 [Neopyropia yezoensis]